MREFQVTLWIETDDEDSAEDVRGSMESLMEVGQDHDYLKDWRTIQVEELP